METFEEAVRESIREFYKGSDFESLSKIKKSKYTKDYFEGIEKDLMPKQKAGKPEEEAVTDEETT